MAKKKIKINEEELRDKIKQELHQKFQERREERKKEPLPSPSKEQQEGFIAEVEEQLLRVYLEEEICSRYPEFVRCENHLNEVVWCTPWELEAENEFYPVDESKFQKFKKKFLGQGGQPKISDPKLAKRVDEMRSKIEANVQERLVFFREQVKKAPKNDSSELEKQIYQEELDKFYSAKKGYKKYINHLSETKWMTKEELKTQEEFFEEVETPAQIFKKRGFYTFIVLGLVTIFWSINNYLASDTSAKAYLLVYPEDTSSQLYIDKILAVGYTPGIPYHMTPGEHEISMIKAGYLVSPNFHNINVNDQDTATVQFNFEKNRFTETGLVRVLSSHPDAGILVNGEFKGTLQSGNELSLPPGDYTLMMQKTGFICIPPQRAFNLKVADTVEIAFRMAPGKIKSGNIESGLVEVRSNIKNADIFLDGLPTNFKTDYVLQKIPFGSHLIRVEKKGYKVYPEEKRVRITENKKQVVADFTLSSTIKRILLKTVPVAADILIDGKLIGNGAVSVSLPLGEHIVEFGDVRNYRKPVLSRFDLTEDSPDHFEYQYYLNFNQFFSAAEDYSKDTERTVQTGYLLNDERFHSGTDAGPEIRLNETINEKVWMLGYAFQYRNPPGRDIIMFDFMVPVNLDLSIPLKMKLWIYQSKDLYPLILKGNPVYSLSVNRFIVKKQVLPTYKENEISEAHYDSFEINELLEPGFNRIRIATTLSTTAHVMLWKIAIE